MTKVQMMCSSALLLASMVLAVGCQKSLDIEGVLAPHTGNEIFETGVNPNAASEDLEVGSSKYIHATRLRVRSTPEVTDSNIVGILNNNDEVQIIDASEELGEFIEIKILKTAATIVEADKYYVGRDYVGAKKAEKTVKNPLEGEYFVIQNIATEIMRVYKKECNGSVCNHKMVMEAEMVAGEDESGRRSVVGNFHVSSWHKFYQDGAGAYPSWYHPDYPMPPRAGSGVTAWTSKKVLPYAGASVRGAFGWYTAHVSPRSSYQWTHGTIGWGSDKKDFIKATRGFWANLFADPRSHGCSRTDNESIAYLRHILPVGSRLIKVYAKEAYLDEERTKYQLQKSAEWNYILTKNGSRKDGEQADRNKVLAAGTPQSQWLEEGTYKIDTHPDAEWFRSGSSGAESGKNGNVYSYDSDAMKGVFLVDAGLLVDYQHPSRVGIGGYSDEFMPHYVKAPEGTTYSIKKRDSFSKGGTTVYSRNQCDRFSRYSDKKECRAYFR